MSLSEHSDSVVTSCTPGRIEQGLLPVTDFPRLEFSRADVTRAGLALREDLRWTAENESQIRDVFRVANNWRESHAYPMNRLRMALVGRMRSLEIKGLTAARLKRMSSVRKKLRKTHLKLANIQDLGGCRAILPAMDDVRRLVEDVKRSSRHRLHREDLYIERPKPDGYRSHHLVFEFVSEGDDEAFAGLKVEMQIRSRLQHSWATAVEAVGLFRKEDIKGGSGDPDWRRLFLLMSAELAEAERCAVGDGVPQREDRVKEIRDLDKRLESAKTLDNLRHAVRDTSTYHWSSDAEKPEYFLVRYDNKNGTVYAEPYRSPHPGAQSLNEIEAAQDKSGGTNLTTVLVEVDKVESLREAFPNYFGDVDLFARNLREITLGKEAREYVSPPQERAPPPPHEPPDLSWFRRRGRWT